MCDAKCAAESSPEQAESLEQVILCHLSSRGPSWATAREIATEIGHPWRSVSRIMMRMPEIEKQSQVWISARYRPRTRTIYRFMNTPAATYPTWLLPAPPAVMVGTGRIVHGYASLHDVANDER